MTWGNTKKKLIKYIEHKIFNRQQNTMLFLVGRWLGTMMNISETVLGN